MSATGGANAGVPATNEGNEYVGQQFTLTNDVDITGITLSLEFQYGLLADDQVEVDIYNDNAGLIGTG